ncbi:MAG: hypothetical protein V4473_01455 [Patescibacteria group bacterium]
MKKPLKKNMTIDGLALMVANGFSAVDKKMENLTDDFFKVRKDLSAEISDLREVVTSTRQEVLNIGDKFVHRYEFDRLSSRLSNLEKKVESKSRK